MSMIDFLYPYHLVAWVTSTVISLFLVFTQKWHGKHSNDSHGGVQKFHDAPTPRIGGLAMFLSLAAAWFALHLISDDKSRLLGLILLSGLPAFGAGLVEDLTKKVSVSKRLIATMVSGVMAWWLTSYSLTTIAIPGADNLLAWLPVSVGFTAFAVGGVANSINIIDGFNGLAGGILIICFSLMGIIAFQVGDQELVLLCILLVFVVAGFMVVNYPLGKIFMGDGGAYLMGFMLAWIAVMLPVRNHAVSVWAPIVICSYPLIETIFSILRRYWTKTDPGQPDSAHLHSLIKVKIVRRIFAQLPQYQRNSLVSPFCWILALLLSVPVLFFYESTLWLMLITLLSFLLYTCIYWLVGRVDDVTIN